MAIRTRTTVLLAGLAALVTVPALAGPEPPALGVPDAAPVERLIARHDGFDFPMRFETPDGRQLASGSYDLALIERGGVYFLQLTSRRTRRGIRVPVEARGRLEAAPERDVQVQLGDGSRTLLMSRDDFVATFPLQAAGGKKG